MLEPRHQKRLLAEDVKRCVVALSGGADSVALLHSIKKLELSVPVVAIHVNHGLQNNADDWQQFCAKYSSSLGVELNSVVVEVNKKGSVEESARLARYEAFENYLEPGDLLLLAHHADDQIETIMLNLLRGSDAFGVRGMPVERRIGRAVLYRPMIDIARSDVIAYCTAHKLEWVEDGSNQNENMDRNFLRHAVLPGLKARFPAMKSALLNAIDRDDEAARLLADYAEADLEMAKSGDGGIKLDMIREMSVSRIVSLLRQFLRQKDAPFPTGRQLRECAQVMTAAREDAMPSLRWSSFEFRRYKGCMYLVHSLPLVEQQSVPLQGKGPVHFAGGVLTMELVVGQGVVTGDDLELRARHGGEKIGLGQTRTLKNIFQEGDIPGWLRSRLPLVFESDELVAVPGISSWNTEGVYAVSRKPKAGQSGWVFTFDIEDRV